MTLDIVADKRKWTSEEVRCEFPALDREQDGKRIAYLDNAATAQRPRAVLDAMNRYYEVDNASVHRGVHTLSRRATEAFESARESLRRFLNAESADEIVLTKGCTESVNLVASSHGRTYLKPGDEILLTTMEHHSNIVPWQLVAAQTGAKIRAIPITDAGEVDLEAYAEMLSDRTRIVGVVHVSNSLGTINPVRRMAEMAHQVGATVVVDGAQAGPHLKIDVREIGADYYTLSGHKMYGPTGVGVLYGRLELLKKIPPYQGGGSMIRTVTFEGSTYADPPAKFEAGTPNIAGFIGLGVAAEYVLELGADRIAEVEGDLLRYGERRLGEIEGVRLIGTAKDKCAILSFVIDGVHPHDVGTVLDAEGVAVRAGHHCTQPLMRRMGVPATVRASLAFYNTREELDRLAAAVRRVREVFQ